ncbi:MAG: YvcK family protein [Chloroflexi bacterium]|nr:YvcK family protein [Chloroflexota bacterium]
MVQRFPLEDLYTFFAQRLNTRFPRMAAELKWLAPGMGVKRWIILLIVGTTIVGLGLAYILVNFYRELGFPDFAFYVTLQFIPRILRGFMFLAIGIGCIALAVVRLNQSLLAAVGGESQARLVDVVYRARQKERGAKIVALGGGTGLSTLLRGLKEYTSNITAIVTVADDGGSSGRIRRELGLPPPGDIRACIAALADSESLITQLFQYRFGEGEGLNGHSFGNLFIAAMANITGSFEQAVAESGRVLAVRGRILPSTLQDVMLSADFHTIKDTPPLRVHGESEIPKVRQPIARVYLRPLSSRFDPGSIRAYPEAVRAILEADVILTGPGSLYTSILPNLLVPGIAEALRAARAPKIYICNVATQLGETEGYSAADHMAALVDHVGTGVFDYMLVNDDLSHPLPVDWTISLIEPPAGPLPTCQVLRARVVEEGHPWRHDSYKLARAIVTLPIDRPNHNGH